MTDIVERLRREGVEFHEQLEAADEIERLQAKEAAAIFSFQETNNMALAEIKRLRAALRNIAIGGIGETNWSTYEMRAYAEDALKP